MTALSRLIERWLSRILSLNQNGSTPQGFVRILLAVTLITFGVMIVFLRINYNLSLGPR